MIINTNNKNRYATRTWGLMLSFIPFGWNSVFRCQYLEMNELLQVRRYTSPYNFEVENVWQNTVYLIHILSYNSNLFSF